MKRLLVLLVSSCFIVFSGLSQIIIVKPYLQDAEPTSMTIMWEADDEGKGYVDWGLTPFNLDMTTLSTPQPGSGLSMIHTTAIPGLTQNSKYYYRVRTGSGNVSHVYHFKTPALPSNESATQIMAVSDMQRDGSNPDQWREIVEDGMVPIIQSELSSDLNALDAILIPGDLVATGGDYAQWKNFFFGPADSLTPYVPLYPVPGNHEYHGSGLPNFIKYFTLPDNGPVGLAEHAWYKDISNTRIIGLNSNSGGVDQDAQLVWLEELLDSTCNEPNIDFVFAELHHPFKSELWTPGENSFTGEVIALLENFTEQCGKASVHFFGHTHAYSRGQSRDHNHLWVNVATAGGAIDNWGEFPNADYDEFNISQDDYGFVLMSIEAGIEPQFTLRRYTRGDDVIEKENELVDEITIKNSLNPPMRPVGIYPDMDTLPATCLKLQANEFMNPGLIHQASHWQIAEGCNFIDSVVSDSWKQNENWYNEINTQEGDDLTNESGFENLVSGNDYCWRVRYRNEFLNWSEWSDPMAFRIMHQGPEMTGNLIASGGGEFGLATWVGDIEALMSEECNSAPAHSGAILFAVGGVCANEQDVGFAHQEIDISTYSTQIDNNELAISFGGHMRDFNGSDVPETYVEVYTENGVLLGTSLSVANATGVWIQKVSQYNIPVGTRKFRLVLKGTRNGGTDNDSYFDDMFAKLIPAGQCSDCYTSNSSQIDFDEDGFCDDLDCNDQDASMFPGAMEICDQKDNNCDGKADSGDFVMWTGNGDGVAWEDDANWDQLFVPLICQHVIIGGADSVSLTSKQYISGLTIDDMSTLFISTMGTLNIHLKATSELQLNGILTNQGKIYIQNPDGDATHIEGGGALINHSLLDLRK